MKKLIFSATVLSLLALSSHAQSKYPKSLNAVPVEYRGNWSDRCPRDDEMGYEVHLYARNIAFSHEGGEARLTRVTQLAPNKIHIIGAGVNEYADDEPVHVNMIVTRNAKNGQLTFDKSRPHRLCSKLTSGQLQWQREQY